MIRIGNAKLPPSQETTLRDGVVINRGRRTIVEGKELLAGDAMRNHFEFREAKIRACYADNFQRFCNFTPAVFSKQYIASDAMQQPHNFRSYRTGLDWGIENRFRLRSKAT